jgi:ATP-dependent DNA helicase PIF1
MELSQTRGKSDIPSLVPEQAYIFERFKNGENVFLSGPAGTGKSYLIKCMVSYLSATNRKFQVCAMTGTAALLLKCNARTLHSWGGIGICSGLRDKVINAVLASSKKKAGWKKVEVLIIDEVSMLSLKVFEIVDEIARRARRCDRPFGGIQVIMTGDFAQLPPIVSENDPDTGAFCFESRIWGETFSRKNQYELKNIHRQSDPQYKSLLLKIRLGDIDDSEIRLLQGCVNRRFDVETAGGCVPVKIFPTRAKTDLVNKIEYDKIREREYVFEYSKTINCVSYMESGEMFSPEVLLKCKNCSIAEREKELEYITANSNFPQILRLKKGSVVMCTSNIDMDNKICNGSQGVVVDIVEVSDTVCFPVVKFYNGVRKQISTAYRQSEEMPCVAVGQMPLMLAWAITIHKTQGATIDLAEIDIGSGIFEYGQTYVALSRVRSLDGLYLTGFNPGRIKAHPKVLAFYAGLEDIEDQMRESGWKPTPTVTATPANAELEAEPIADQEERKPSKDPDQEPESLDPKDISNKCNLSFDAFKCPLPSSSVEEPIGGGIASPALSQPKTSNNKIVFVSKSAAASNNYVAVKKIRKRTTPPKSNGLMVDMSVLDEAYI